MWLLDELKKRKEDSSVAIIHRDNRVSYAELWKRSESIAKWMDANLSTDAPVVIYGDKDAEIIEIMVASLKTGRAYVPIDVTFPVERVKKIAKIAQAEILFNISNKELGIETESLCYLFKKSDVNNMVEKEDTFDDVPESHWVDGDDICYMMFTSGSTGEPKGVQISKNNIINFTEGFGDGATISGTTALNQVAYSFDLSVPQIHLLLPAGITLFCVDKEMCTDFKAMFDYLRNSDIAVWVATPSFTEMCAANNDFDEKLLPSLEKFIFVGEVLTKNLVKLLWERFPHAKVVNGYGPTEGTVLLTYCTIDEVMMDDKENELPVGRFFESIQHVIEPLSESDKEFAVGKGELIVTGKSISKGYYKNPQATEKSFFVKDGDVYPSYRTGDIVYEHDGLLYFCGRKDFQIKLNGYRIEMDDIAENINKIDGVQNNVVIPVYSDGKVKHLAAFVKLKPVLRGGTNPLSIRKELLKLVPSYMIPKKIFVVDNFPLNVNGKIDRKALAEAYL